VAAWCVRRCLLQLCGVFVDGAPAWAGADDNDWFAYASPPYPVLAQADGRAGAGRARRPVAVGPVHGLEELGCGRVHRLARDGLDAQLVPGRLVPGRLVVRRRLVVYRWGGAATVSCSEGRGGKCRYRLVRAIPVLAVISVMVWPVSRRCAA
jgi:hypothetical protein